MIDCSVIGDTIALNLQSSLQCAEVRAAPNLTSSRVINISNGNNVFHEVCILSAGSYDYYGSTKTRGNLEQIRNNTNCKFYVWIPPINNPAAAEDVNELSEKYKDDVVTFSQTNDNITPANYGDLAKAIVNDLNAKGL